MSNTEIVNTQVQVPAIANGDPDFQYVEENVKKVIDDSQAHLDTLGNLADQSQAPRAYEVLHNFYRMVLEANRTLLDSKKIKQEIEEKNNPDRHLKNSSSRIQNNLFVGSTAELQRFLSGKVIDNNDK